MRETTQGTWQAGILEKPERGGGGAAKVGWTADKGSDERQRERGGEECVMGAGRIRGRRVEDLPRPVLTEGQALTLGLRGPC